MGLLVFVAITYCYKLNSQMLKNSIFGGDLNREGDVARTACGFIDSREEILAEQRNDARLGHERILNGGFSTRRRSAHHRVRFTRTSLTIRENAHVVAFQRMLQHLYSNVLVHSSLGRKVRIFWLFRSTENVNDLNLVN